MITTIKKYLPYLSVVIAIVLPWFFYSGYLFATDMVWGPKINIDWTSNWFLMNLVTKILSFVFSVAFLEKIFIALTIFIVLWGGRKIASYFLEDKIAIFVISLFALFNPFVYDRMMYGQVGIVLAFGLFILAIGYLLDYYKNGKGKSLTYFGIFAGLTLQFSVHFIFFLGIIFVLFLVLLFLKYLKPSMDSRLRGNENGWKNFIKYIFIAGALCILLNANWIVGNFVSKNSTANFVSSGITKQDLLAFKTSGSSNGQVLSNVLLMSGFWGKDQYRYADLTSVKSNWGKSFFFLLPLILIGLYFGIRKKETRALSIGLSIVFVVSVVLASGIGVSYFQNFTYWLFDNVPLYKGLRETQKWVSVITLIYLIFISIGVKTILETKIFSVHKKMLLTFVGAVIIMQAPFLLWGFSGQLKPTQYPADWNVVNKEMQCSANDKFLFLPWHLYMSFNWVGKIIATPAGTYFDCPVISSSAMEWGGIYDNSQNSDSQKVNAWLSAKGNTDLLKNNEPGIKYILLAKEIDWKNYLWIEKLPNVKLINETETLKLYAVQL